MDSKGTIFVSPGRRERRRAWSKVDVDLTDDILAQLEGDLCIDKSRIFATGFSFGFDWSSRAVVEIRFHQISERERALALTEPWK